MKGIHVTLAEHQGVGCVRMCECGSVNLNIGIVTLHLDPESFVRTAALLREATEQYAERSKSTSLTSDVRHALSFPGRFTN